MIEEFKTIGAFAGLLTGVMLVYDRLVKGRPIASVTVTERGTGKYACIRVSNISPYDITILDLSARPKVYFLSENLETRYLLEGAVGRTPFFMLKPGENKELFVVPLYKDKPLAIMNQRVTFLIWWRRGNATWIPQIPVWILTNTLALQKCSTQEMTNRETQPGFAIDPTFARQRRE
jgi:hypothetical protein